MKRTASVLVLSAIAVSTLFALLVYYLRPAAEPDGPKMPRMPGPSSEVSFHQVRNSSKTTSATISSYDAVLPLAELDGMVEKYITDKDTFGVSDFALQEAQDKWTEFRAGGGTLWGSEQWMKPKEYYQGLDTVELARECFSRPIYYLEMAIFADPRFGLQRLEVMHDGFAELLAREDLWQGILDFYDYAASKIRYGEDPVSIVLNSMNLCHLSVLFVDCPAFKKQIEGREMLFIQAQISALKSYVQYLDATRGMEWDDVGVFFREPGVLAQTALMLTRSVDEQSYGRIRSALEDQRLNRDQDPGELENYLKEVIALFQKEFP